MVACGNTIPSASLHPLKRWVGEGPSSTFLCPLWSSTDPATFDVPPVFRASTNFAIPPVTLFSSLFRRSSLAPAGRAPPIAGCTVRGFLVCLYQQGFVSFGVMLLSVISALGGYFTSFHCRSSYHPVASSSCAFRTDMIFSNPPRLDSVFFLQSWTQGWGVLVCPWPTSFL